MATSTSERRGPQSAGGDIDAGWRQWMRRFGGHVRRVREFVGLSQEELARRAGLSQGTVSRFELGRGLNTPFLGIIKMHMVLARALGGMDPATLSDDVHRFLRQMEILALPEAADEPPRGTEFERLTVTPDPELERLIRLYRELPANRRAAFVALLDATATAFRE